jgi:hypothetical protein
MRLNATRVECGTLGTVTCACRVVAEQLPDVAVLVFDRDLRFELAAASSPRRSASPGSSMPPPGTCRSCWNGRDRR